MVDPLLGCSSTRSFFLSSSTFAVAPSHFAQRSVLQLHQWHAASRVLIVDVDYRLVSERDAVDCPPLVCSSSTRSFLFLSDSFAVAPSHFAQLRVLQRHQRNAASQILVVDVNYRLVSKCMWLTIPALDVTRSPRYLSCFLAWSSTIYFAARSLRHTISGRDYNIPTFITTLVSAQSRHPSATGHTPSQYSPSSIITSTARSRRAFLRA